MEQINVLSGDQITTEYHACNGGNFKLVFLNKTTWLCETCGQAGWMYIQREKDTQ